MDDFMKFVTDIASYLLGAEGIVLTIVFIAAGKPTSLPIAFSAFLLILSILFCVLVLTGAINSAANPKSVRWKKLAQWASNFTVWFFAGSLLIVASVILWGLL